MSIIDLRNKILNNSNEKLAEKIYPEFEKKALKILNKLETKISSNPNKIKFYINYRFYCNYGVIEIVVKKFKDKYNINDKLRCEDYILYKKICFYFGWKQHFITSF